MMGHGTAPGSQTVEKTFDGSDWSNNTILNQTADLSVPDKAKSMYTITDLGGSDGYWGVYGA